MHTDGGGDKLWNQPFCNFCTSMTLTLTLDRVIQPTFVYHSSTFAYMSIFLLVVFLKALFSVLYFSSCIPPHSALLYLLTFSKPPPLCRWYSTFFFLPSSTIYLRRYKSPTAPLDMHHLTFGIDSLLHSVNLIVFTLLLWLTSSYAYHLITVITFVLTICHSLDLSLQT